MTMDRSKSLRFGSAHREAALANVGSPLGSTPIAWNWHGEKTVDD